MFDLHKKILLTFLNSYLQEKQKELKEINFFGKDAIIRLQNFLQNGKMLRGSLVLQSYLLFKDNFSDDAIKVGSALELQHASLIIHDDIMDQDGLRRGEKSIFAQYQDFAKERNFPMANLAGQGLGICIGDLGFFLGYELLSKVSKNSQDLATFCSSELQKVAIAQMQDLYVGGTEENFTEQEILSLYKYKTGRYTFSLPLSLGARLAGQPEETLKKLEMLGEFLGIAFQIKDDELDLFGNEKIMGKPLGSDIRENKKTLLRFFLFNLGNATQKEKLKKIFGNPQVSNIDTAFVQNLAGEFHIDKKIKELIADLEKKSQKIVEDLHFDNHKKNFFLNLLEYNTNRQK